jgi:uncharacterized membrane protein YadS
LAVGIGLGLFALALANFAGVEVFGWVAKTSVWVDPAKIVAPVSKRFSTWPGLLSLLASFAFMLAIMTVGAKLMGVAAGQFARGFALLLPISYACWMLGHYASIAATSNQLQKFGLAWSLNLTGEAGFIIALVVGLVIGNLLPGLARTLKAAIRPEWYIQTAIVLLGATLAVKSVEARDLAKALMFRGLCAIVEAYLIYWALVYLVARRFFGFSREWAAPLASGVSICGVSAAVATGAAIRARPAIPIMVSSLVVIFAVFELLLLPFVAQHFLADQPLVAGAWMGLAVKTDGAAMASGAIADGLIRAQALATSGLAYQEGWVTLTATTVKVFIDVFIGIWSFLLAVIWCSKIQKKPGQQVRVIEIWQRFPKFILGYVLTFVLLLALALGGPSRLAAAKTVVAGTDLFRVLFFVLAFFCIGLVSNVRKLWEEGIGRLAAVYVVCLFGFIIWIGLLISWLFFHGIKPPLVTG